MYLYSCLTFVWAPGSREVGLKISIYFGYFYYIQLTCKNVFRVTATEHNG